MSEPRVSGMVIGLGELTGYIILAGTTAERPQLAAGGIWYNTERQCLEYFDGSTWHKLADGDQNGSMLQVSPSGGVEVRLFTDRTLAGTGNAQLPLRVEPTALAEKVAIAVTSPLSGNGTQQAPLSINVRQLADVLDEVYRLRAVLADLETLKQQALRPEQIVGGQGIQVTRDGQGRLVIALQQQG